LPLTFLARGGRSSRHHRAEPHVMRRITSPRDQWQAITGTEINSGLQRGLAIDLITSSAVNFPITNANLRLVVVRRGIASIRCTYSTVRLPARFTFTTNLVFVSGCSLPQQNWALTESGSVAAAYTCVRKAFRPSHVALLSIVRSCWRRKWSILHRRNQAIRPHLRETRSDPWMSSAQKSQTGRGEKEQSRVGTQR
jgi:hypothetical protein